ncbi:hypothetical protein QBC35DRAFT_251962 [Podospora australis]|uniref:Indole-diterpene biosynthesis protein PaxU n=1 Tax=Podospora australis TaxID=1536484 RepID=A0AAN7AH17_9PEZI|nr:hypothetical protein QBC35DRAFT_251962 [Podospora australis]
MGKPPFSLPGFLRLSPSIHLQDPDLFRCTLNHPQSSSPPSSQGRNPPPPDLIIITSWTGAIDRHVAKYTASYNALFPGTPILVITTVVSDLTLRSTKHKIKSLAPAVDYLLTRNLHVVGPFFSPTPNPFFPSPFSSILLHAFSEGGSFAAVSLAKAFLRHSSHTKIPIAAFIFDSTPGTSTPSLRSATAAFSRSCPSSSLGLLAYTAFRLSPHTKSWLELTREGINDLSLWDIHNGIPRTYLFSEQDDLVLWQDVQRHGLESAEKYGVKSLMVRFKRTAHCGHARDNDPASKKVYWAAVRQTWEAREDGGLGIKLGLGRRVSLDSLCEGG